MQRSRTTVGKMRRMVAVASAAVALLALVAEPALAASGYYSMSRSFAVSGPRTVLNQNLRIADSAPGLYVGSGMNWGPAEGGSTLGVDLMQRTATAASRGIYASGWGKFKNVSSPNNSCTFEHIEGGFGVLKCDDQSYDWLGNTTYRLTVVREPVPQNTNGWLWEIRISRYNATTKKWMAAEKIVSFRLPQGSLAEDQHGANLFANVDDCTKINRVQATYWQPFGAGSTTTWKPTQKYNYACPASAMKVSGTTTGPVTFTIEP